MCLNPKTIRIKRASREDVRLATRVFAYENGYKQFVANGPDLPPDIDTSYSDTEEITVPCGQCPSCLRLKQLDIAARCRIEAEKSPLMHLVTLTYDDDHLPFSVTLSATDKATGEQFIDVDSHSAFLTPDVEDVFGVTHDEVLADFQASQKDYIGWRKYIELPEVMKFMAIDKINLEPQYHYNAVITPSLRRLDVRLWIKKARERYARKHKTRPNIRYFAVGEYGTHTCRPHYHLVVFGVETHVIREMLSSWDKGFVHCRKVSPINPDGSDGLMKSANYIGKYVSKGFVDAPSVMLGYAQKSRYFCSKDFGVPEGITYKNCGKAELATPIEQYYRCDDVGRFDDTDKPFHLMSDADALGNYYDQVRNRSKISIRGYSIILPKIVKRRLFYVKVTDSEGKIHYLASFVQYLRGIVARNRNLQLCSQQPQPCYDEKKWKVSLHSLSEKDKNRFTPQEWSALVRFFERYSNDQF